MSVEREDTQDTPVSFLNDIRRLASDGSSTLLTTESSVGPQSPD